MLAGSDARVALVHSLWQPDERRARSIVPAWVYGDGQGARAGLFRLHALPATSIGVRGDSSVSPSAASNPLAQSYDRLAPTFRLHAVSTVNTRVVLLA